MKDANSSSLMSDKKGVGAGCSFGFSLNVPFLVRAAYCIGCICALVAVYSMLMAESDFCRVDIKS